MGAEVNSREVLAMFDASKNVAENALEYMALDFWREGTKEAPVGKYMGGTLRDSIQAHPQSKHTWIVGTNLEYAGFVHEGRGEVRPKNKKVLRWMGPGGPIFSMYSGPTKPNRFFDRAEKTTSGKLQEYLDMAFKDAGV